MKSRSREGSRSSHHVLLRSMARQTSKPPTARVSGWGVTGSPEGKGRFLSKTQFAELRRKRADVHAKLRQMVYAERELRR
jgi:hypothetical protein